MSHLKVYLSLSATLVIILVWVFYLALTEPREFKLLLVRDTNACFLVDIRYSYKEEGGKFHYWGKKNKGVFVKESRGLASELTPATINNIESGYQKIKNKRVYEYKVSDKYILRDEFVFAKKSPLNLVPYVDDCPRLKELYKEQIEIL